MYSIGTLQSLLPAGYILRPKLADCLSESLGDLRPMCSWLKRCNSLQNVPAVLLTPYAQVFPQLIVTQLCKLLSIDVIESHRCRVLRAVIPTKSGPEDG
jgi:hypothetical protein